MSTNYKILDNIICMLKQLAIPTLIIWYFEINTYTLGILCMYLVYPIIYRTERFDKIPDGTQKVPEVDGRLPLVGHGIAFSKDIVGFVRAAYQKYGPVFKIKVFRKTIVVVCDHKLKDEFFKAKEEDMSLYSVLNDLYFGDAFSDNQNNLPRIINIVKGTIKVRFDDFAAKIVDEATKMIEQARAQKQCVSLSPEMIRFVSCTSARCFIGVELTDEFYKTLMDFTRYLNKIVVMTYFFPKWLLRATMSYKLRKFRQTMTHILNPEIEKYRVDHTKKESLVLRGVVDYVDPITGQLLTNSQICEVVICLLYVSSENTALGLTATMIDLASNSKYWNMVRDESKKFLAEGDVQGLFKSPIIDACVMESARINTHIFALDCKPMSVKTLGSFYIGDVDCVAMCEPMMMVHDCAEFVNPKEYNPERFLGDTPESKGPKSSMTWGAGRHLCPGRDFAKYEIKAAMALITNNFAPFEFISKGDLNYFSPSAFAEREVKVVLTPLDNPCLFRSKNVHHEDDGTKTCNYKVKIINTSAGHTGWLIQNCLTYEEQNELYLETIRMSEGSTEHTQILEAYPTRAFPITYHNLEYTNTSNCEAPKKYYNWAMQLATKLCRDQNTLMFDGKLTNDYFNSFYAQLFTKQGTMDVHKDIYVNWGISISLGASCEFQFDDHIIMLHSGDVFISDFSKVDHGVKKILEGTSPGWFNELPKSKTLGYHRCSIQIRNVKPRDDYMTIDQFKKMVQSY